MTRNSEKVNPYSTLDDSDTHLSKSELKRQMQDLQKLGERLIALSETELATIPLPENLLELIQFAKTLKSHEAKRRHLQFIGKTMRHVDPLPIQTALKTLEAQHHKNVQLFHLAEKWRERLMQNASDIENFTALYVVSDKEKLRGLLKEIQEDQIHHRKAGKEKILFRYLIEILQKANG